MSEKEGYSSGQAPGLKTSAGAQVGSASALPTVGGEGRPAWPCSTRHTVSTCKPQLLQDALRWHALKRLCLKAWLSPESPQQTLSWV